MAAKTTSKRPRPPARLSPRAKEIWRQTIGLVPGEWQPIYRFQFELYCRARATLERLEAEVVRLQSEGVRVEGAEASISETRDIVREIAEAYGLSPASRAAILGIRRRRREPRCRA
jgi:phage terminase small subunit